MSTESTPHWNGKPITPGWWWLQFSDGPGPRHWDGTFWDRGSYFAGAEDYADNPVLGPCHPPPTPTTGRRVPRRDDPFITVNAARMYELLVVVDNHPPGVPLTEPTRQSVQNFFTDAQENGIDTIGVSEGGFADD